MKPITFIAAIVMAVALAIWSQGCAKLALDTTCPAGSIGVSFAHPCDQIANATAITIAAMKVIGFISSSLVYLTE